MISEIKTPPTLALKLLEKLSFSEEKSTALGDLCEFYAEIAEEKGAMRADLWFVFQAVLMVGSFLFHSIYWSFVMFSNYLKVTLRNFKKHLSYSLINILGLAFGMACFIIIMLYVSFETNYDSYHKDADRIFRVARRVTSEGRESKFSSIPYALKPVLKEDYPQVETVARIGGMRQTTVKYKDRLFHEYRALKWADNDIFNVFTIPFKQGDQKNALVRPKTAVLTETMANKYFGEEDPVGKTIVIDTTNFEITGVVEDHPSYTHAKFGILMSAITQETSEFIEHWNCPTYVKLFASANAEEFEKLIGDLKVKKKEEQDKDNAVTKNFLQPIRDIHLHSHNQWELEPNGNPIYVYLFSIVGIIILLIAGINFINLSTARSANRAKEVGMRKVVGARRKQLIAQFLGESVLLSIIALLLALVLVILLLPYFNALSGLNIAYNSLLDWKILLSFIALIGLFGIAAGLYPAFFLSSFKPASVLKGKLVKGSGGASFRKAMVVGQFAISITLIIGSFIIFRQLDFMKNRSLGFNKDQKLILTLPSRAVSPSQSASVKAEFMKNSTVSGAALSSSVPGKWRYTWRMYPNGKKESHTRMVNTYQADADYLKLYELDVVAGKAFNEETKRDTSHFHIMLNETAAKSFGWNSPEDAVGKNLYSERYLICGVLKDYHYKGLQNPIEPLSVWLIGEDYQYLTLEVLSDDDKTTIAQVKETYSKLFPSSIFEYFFLDTDFARQYQNEERIGKVFGAFTFLGCLSPA